MEKLRLCQRVRDIFSVCTCRIHPHWESFVMAVKSSRTRRVPNNTNHKPSPSKHRLETQMTQLKGLGSACDCMQETSLHRWTGQKRVRQEATRPKLLRRLIWTLASLTFISRLKKAFFASTSHESAYFYIGPRHIVVCGPFFIVKWGHNKQGSKGQLTRCNSAFSLVISYRGSLGSCLLL